MRCCPSVAVQVAPPDHLLGLSRANRQGLHGLRIRGLRIGAYDVFDVASSDPLTAQLRRLIR
eukprot:13085037-Alexandrium_andersonii.AAC.1